MLASSEENTSGSFSEDKMQLVVGVLALTIAAGLAAPEPPVDIHPATPSRAISATFQSALDRNITATWKSVSLRSILDAISREREIAILLDRRINSGRELPWDFSGRPLRVELAQLAEAHGAAVSNVGNTVYIGPISSARKLRTLVHLREAEIFDRAASLPKGRDLELVRRATARWGDLARPADLVGQISSLYKLEVQGREQIPHDLWAGCTLPAASAAEALLLVLVQFDLSFEWTPAAAGIRIVPVAEKVAFARIYKPKSGTLDATAAKWRTDFPGAEMVVREKEIEVTGTVEEHEALAAILRPHSSKRASNGKPGTEPTPLHRQTFTLKVQRASVRSLFEELEKRGIVFEYDEQALKTAGVDLDTRINLDVEKADADAFFRAICEPVGLKFQIGGNNVSLSPK